MASYKIGSIGDLISGKTSDVVETKTIVYRELAPQSQQADNSKQSSDDQGSPKKRVSFGTTTVVKIERKTKDIGAKKRKPEFAGDEESTPVRISNKSHSSEDPSEVKADDTFSRNAARRVHIKNNTRKHVDDPERNSRTIFVGNIPYAHSNKKKLTKFFSNYGQVESVRIRCAPLKDPRTSKKVAVIKNEFHPQRSSISAFVVFKTPDNAKAALEANGTVFHDHHLRVDIAKSEKNEIDSKKSVFLGNVSFAAEEEDLWQMFAECGKIESVRIVRDPITAVSKGVAYVNFETSDAAELALHLDGNTLKKRNISVKRYRPSAKSTLEKPLTQKPVRHKTLDDNARVKLSAGDEKRMAKKAKRKMRREAEQALGIERKKKKRDDKTVSDQTKEEPNESNGKEIKKNKHIRFQGQTVEESKKKKKKINKGAIRKKKIAFLLSGEKKKKTV